MSEKVQSECQGAGRNARAATRHHRALEIDAGALKQLTQRLRRQQRLGLWVGDLIVREVEAPGDPPRAASRPTLRHAPLEAWCGTRIEHLLLPGREVGTQLCLAAHQPAVEARSEQIGRASCRERV